jgi:phenylalanyl-tRNA synthetase beta chain
MPVIRFREEDLHRLLGKAVPRDELLATIPLLGADLGEVKGPEWSIEFFPDRPDLFTVEGIARALRQFLAIAPGLARYRVRAAQHSVMIDSSVASVRPFLAAAFVRDVPMSGRLLESLIALQEDLHWGVGARRRKVAIGVHDAASVRPPFTYRAVQPSAVSFVPLGSTHATDLAGILESHPKGKEFAPILAGASKYPIIQDSEGKVLSFPPIINGTLTEVRPTSRDLFLDVTGTDRVAVNHALNLLATSLAEAGGVLEGVRLEGAEASVTPHLEPHARRLRIDATNRLLGTEYGAAEIIERLGRMGYDAHPASEGAGILEVHVPSYRADVLHEVDLIEDVAIGARIDSFTGAPLRSVTHGKPLAGSVVSERARSALVGQGFLEIMSLSLSNESEQFLKMGLSEHGAVRVKNPATVEHTMLRVSLLPSLLHVLSRNTHRDLPQRLFEVGVVTRLDAASGEPVSVRRVAGVAIAGAIGFTDAKSIVAAFLRDMGHDAKIEPVEDPYWIPGRAARIAGIEGSFGELHPRTLQAFGLGHPTVGFEFALAPLAAPRTARH